MSAGRDTYCIVTGGGTAGHVLPALAIADALVSRGHDRASLRYVGARRGVEARLVPPTGLRMTLLPGRGIQRRVTPANLVALAGLAVAFARALVLVGRCRPRVVVAVGGYASVSVALASVVWRVPLVVVEQNAAPGAANRLLSRFASATAVAFEGTPLPRATVTGNPVRAEVLEAAEAAADPSGRARAKEALGVDSRRRLVLVTGGSLGALSINEAVLEALGYWAGRADLAVHHVVGRRDWERVRSGAPASLGSLDYRPVEYEHDMAAVLSAADLAVCRAGSGTVFELAGVGLPAVLVPSPWVTDDQQTANATRLVAEGAAVLVADAELDGARLVAEVDELLGDPDRLASMSAAARRLARPDAAAAVADLAELHARG